MNSPWYLDFDRKPNENARSKLKLITQNLGNANASILELTRKVETTEFLKNFCFVHETDGFKDAIQWISIH